MKDIKNIINEMTIENIKKLNFSYKDIISIVDSNIDKKHLNYWIWKYYTGNITIDEHNRVKETLQEYMVYKVYTIIFSIKQPLKWYEDILNCLDKNDYDYNCLSDEVTDIWLMRPRDFKYEGEFRKLIFMFYLLTKEKRFRQIALDFFNENKYVHEYIEKNTEYSNMFLIYRKEDSDYKKYYGLECCKSDVYSNNNNNNNNDSFKDYDNNTQNEDWLTERFEF